MKGMENNSRRTPKQRRALTTIDKILSTAAFILEQEGLDRLNTNYLAKKSSLGVGTIYQYFNNKESIIIGLLERQHKRRINALKKQVFELKNTSLEVVVEGLIKALFEFQKRSPRLEQILLEKQYSYNIDQLEEDLDDKFITLLQRYIALNNIEFNVTDVRLAMKILVTSIKAVSSHYLFTSKDYSEEQMISELKEMTLRYVR